MTIAKYMQSLLEKLPAGFFRGGKVAFSERGFGLIGKLLPAPVVNLGEARAARLLYLSWGIALLGVSVGRQTAEKGHTQRDSTQSRR